jgi:hypothetical protein
LPKLTATKLTALIAGGIRHCRLEDARLLQAEIVDSSGGRASLQQLIAEMLEEEEDDTAAARKVGS